MGRMEQDRSCAYVVKFLRLPCHFRPSQSNSLLWSRVIFLLLANADFITITAAAATTYSSGNSIWMVVTTPCLALNR